MGVNLLGRVRPKGQTREYPHYTTTAAGKVAYSDDGESFLPVTVLALSVKA